MIIFPSLEECSDSQKCGGKAHGLNVLIKNGYTPPKARVVLDEYFQKHLKNCKLEHKIIALNQKMRCDDLVESEIIGERIRTSIIDTSLDEKLLAALHFHYTEEWEGKTLVVRSSAVGEDSVANSFAGQLDSFLEIKDMEALEPAIRQTWASMYSSRSISYQIRKKICLQNMGVIIQEQVEAIFSGVLFTKSPINTDNNNNDNTMLVEYCHGLGEALVSGSITPSTIIFSHDGSIKQHILQSDYSNNLDILTYQETLLQLAKTALALEKLFAAPLDIEWSIDKNGVLYLLQARPITTAFQYDDKTQILWTNANISENFPDQVSPLLYSIAIQGYAAYFRNLGLGFGMARKRIFAMQDVLEHLIGVHGGRLYYNLTNIHTLLHLAPFGNWLTRFFNEFVGASEFPALSATYILDPIEKTAELIRMPFMVMWQYLTLKRRIRKFEHTVDDFCKLAKWNELPLLSIAKLRQHLLGFMNIRLHRWNNAALADTAAMITYGLLKLSLKRWLKEQENSNLHNALLNGLTDIASSKPVIKLWDLSRVVRAEKNLFNLFHNNEPEVIWRQLFEPEHKNIKQEILEYIECWGFRGSGELMLTHPSPEENPLPTISLLKMYVELESDSPLELMQHQSEIREQITNSIIIRLTPSTWRRVPLLSRAWWFAYLLQATQASIRLRERARFQQARLYVRLRHIVMAMGKHLHSKGMLNEPEDVFFLTEPELSELTSGHSMFPYTVQELIKLRKQASSTLVDFIPPDSFSLNYGEYLATDQKYTAEYENIVSKTLDGQALKGISACGGYIQGVAKVLHASNEAHALNSGDILVTRQTDPGWASVFFLVKGLVAERGGMLSHGAIIAREYGIPAVVGVADATKIIQSGKQIAIHGEQGLVEIIS